MLEPIRRLVGDHCHRQMKRPCLAPAVIGMGAPLLVASTAATPLDEVGHKQIP